ncbi:hypothetical protein [Yersinia pseudotuberculosis]|nr:hypothetical protein [Yersinia pseudotuberculosis]KGA65843.1 hypothetical protein DJ55_3632 [Yersinia pseudotuberculosis]
MGGGLRSAVSPLVKGYEKPLFHQVAYWPEDQFVARGHVPSFMPDFLAEC